MTVRSSRNPAIIRFIL